MESTSIEYTTERHCDLQQVGDLLDSKSYGIGMKHGRLFIFDEGSLSKVLRLDKFSQRNYLPTVL